MAIPSVARRHPARILPAIALLLTLTIISPARAGASDSAGFDRESAGPECAACHAEQAAEWATSVHAAAASAPAYQELLATSHDRAACAGCHAPPGAVGAAMAGGLTCQTCHGESQAGHPGGATMVLPADSAACRACHQAGFSQWQESKHAAQGVGCFDCHEAHSQGLRLGSPEAQCRACHTETQTSSAHAKHGVAGIACASCHMAEELTETAANNGVQVAMSDHGFEVGSKVCIRCHGAEPERQSSAGGSRLLAAARDPDTATDLQATRIAELEQQVHAEKSATARVRSAAAIGFGLALGAGGFFGLVVGLGAVVLLRRRQS